MKSFVFLMFVSAFGLSSSVQKAKARSLVRRALEAKGGEQMLRCLRSVQWKASGYRNKLEQSERASNSELSGLSQAEFRARQGELGSKQRELGQQQGQLGDQEREAAHKARIAFHNLCAPGGV